MAALAGALPWISAGVGALSALSQANNAKREADATAARLRLQAGQEQASAQHKAVDTLRTGRLTSSRALALLASSGASASDPGSEKILSDLAAETEYRVQADLYGGEVRAARLRDEATTADFQGKSAKNAGYVNAFASGLQGYSSFYSKYRRDSSAPPGDVPDSSDD